MYIAFQGVLDASKLQIETGGKVSWSVFEAWYSHGRVEFAHNYDDEYS